MNTLDHLLLLKKTMIDDPSNRTLVKSVNNIWCKGDKLAYTNVVVLLADSIRYFWNIQSHINRDFKHIFYPVSRSVRRHDYQCLKAYDKYFHSGHGASAIIHRSIKQLDIFRLSNIINNISVEIDGVAYATCNDIAVNHIIGAHHSLHLELQYVWSYDEYIVDTIKEALVDRRRVCVRVEGVPCSTYYDLNITTLIDRGPELFAFSDKRITLSHMTFTIPTDR